MGNAKKAPDRPAATAGAVLKGAIPGGWEVVRAIVSSVKLCTREEWVELGRPAVCIRYALGYRDDDFYGFTYCHTGLMPWKNIMARVVTPSNCRGIEVGIVTAAGEHWVPADIVAVNDDAAARDFVRRRIGRDQPICYWDYSLSADNVARYVRDDYTLTTEPIWPDRPVGPEPVEVARAADDGNPHAAESGVP